MATPPTSPLTGSWLLRAHSGADAVIAIDRLGARISLGDLYATAAVQGAVPIILTFNLRHFKTLDLDPWGIRATHPQSFLLELFRLEPQTVTDKLQQQAAERNRTLSELLDILNQTVPDFVARIAGQ